MSSIHLDGGETSVIRALGFGGSAMKGADLLARLSSMGAAQLCSTMQTLIAVGYITTDGDLDREEDLEKISFAVNPGYARDLKEALDPEPPTRSRRVRRQ